MHGHEGRAECDLGLAETDVPADEPSIGLGLTRSWITAWIAARWSGVLLEPKLVAKAS